MIINRIINLVVNGLCGLLVFANAHSAEKVIAEKVIMVEYPDIRHPYYAERDKYFHQLLRLALEHSGQAFNMIPVELPEYSENRSAHFLDTGRYDVHWLNTTAERERTLQPIRIPLYKGAIGWRVFFIREDSREQFAQINDLQGLRKIKAGQGYDWPDMAILKHGRLPVESSSHWEGMFKMLRIDRIQYFPRSIVEILSESRVPAADGLVIEPTLILKYPAAYYFFVKKENNFLAQLIDRGLNKAVENGSLDALFMTFFGEDIQRLNLEKRHIISMDYPSVGKSMPLHRKELWFGVDWFARQKSGEAVLD